MNGKPTVQGRTGRRRGRSNGRSEPSNWRGIGMGAAAVLGAAALGVAARRAKRSRTEPGARHDGGIHVRKTITVDRPREEVYDFWRDFENLPRFMHHLESVQVTDEGHSHWKTSGPAGASAEWDAELVDDQRGERIAWRSVKGSQVGNRGAVTFRDAPGDRGTEVDVELAYDPPGGAVTNAIATLFREAPGQQIHDDLRAFKQMLETGEVLVSDATARPGPHPAQPARR